VRKRLRRPLRRSGPGGDDPGARRLRRAARRRRPGGAPRRHARGLPQDADPPDRPARPLRDHRHAAGGQLDQPGPQPAAQGHLDGQGAGRGRPRPLPLRRGGDPRGRPRRPAGPAPLGSAEVLLDLQLPDPQLGRRGCDRLAGRRRRHRQPGAAVPLLLRSLRPRHGAGLQGGVLPPAAGLRDPPHALARHPGAAGDGPGRRRPLLAAEPDDVRPARRRLAQLRAVDGLGDQALLQRRPAPALRRHDRAAGRGPRPHAARRRHRVERAARPLRLLADRLHRALRGHQGQRPLQRAADGPPHRCPQRRCVGARGGHGVRREGRRARERGM
ncbi:MAG: 1,2-phenylacetyl-CoA epoxidase, subunit A, partial [uncultured Nocardioides sp.]